MKRVIPVAVMAMAIVATWTMSLVRADDKPKFTSKEVMAEAHKKGLLKKVQAGTATDEEKTKLVELYEALALNKPPKGEAESWKAKTDALVAAAKAAKAGEADAGKKLEAASKCGACHSVHK